MEWQPSTLSHMSSLSIFADGEMGDNGFAKALVGVSFHFGSQGVSLIDREFGHRNEEAMLVMWEKDQRRFLFFWKEKLYKQFIAYNADKFKGMDFETIVKMGT